MTRRQGRFAALKVGLRAGAAAIGLAAAGAVALPLDAAWAQAAPAPAAEISRYQLRLMLQRFDGARESSHTQAAGLARQRRGDESWTEVNFGHGSVVTTTPRNVRAGSFINTSGVEAGIRYDHATGTLTGPPALAGFHNERVRPLLGSGPATGADASWSATVTPAQLGFAALGTQPIRIELSRRYFRHDGRDYVLVHYRLPSFTYDLQGRPVVHWGEGVALTDPGFATIYWNAALHRAVANEQGGSGRPYRYSRTAAAVDSRGNPLIDPRRMPEAAPHFARFYGHANEEVMGYTDRDGVSDQQPLAFAGRLDTLALALAEGGGGATGQLAAAYLSDSRGNEAARPAPRPLLEAAAQRVAPAQAVAEAQPPQTASVPHAAASNVSRGSELKRAGPSKGGQSGGSGGSSTQPGGQLRQDMEQDVRTTDVIETTGQWAEITAGSAEETRAFSQITAEVGAFRQRTLALQAEYEAARAEFEATQRALQSAPAETVMTPEASARAAELQREIAETDRIGDLRHQAYMEATAEYARNPDSFDAWDEARRASEAANTAHLQAIQEFESVLSNADNYRVPDATTNLARRAQQEAEALTRIQQQMSAHAAEGVRVAQLIQEVPPSALARWARAAGTVLGPFGIALDGYNIGAAAANVANELERNPAAGQVNVSRQYGITNPLFWIDISVDFVGLAGSALTGDVPGTFAAASSIATSSLTDIFLSARGLRAVNQLNREITEEGTRLAREQRLQEARRREAADQAFWETIRGLDAEIAALDRLPNARELALQRLAELRARREEAARLAEAERQRLIAEARAENERIYQENLRRPPTAEEWAQFNRDIEAAMRPDYPTAPPPTPEQVAARLAQAEERRRQEAAELAAAAAAAAEAEAQVAAEAQAREEDLAEAQAEAQAQREQDAQDRSDRNDAAEERGLEVSSLDIEPVTFEPVNFEPPVWDPPVFEPPVWVPPEFDPPDPSEIPWTDFDDDNWLQQGDNLAYDYGDMAGVVETDLSRWAEWLATQNVRELTRLALLAGYPNLASALADAENIIRLSQDEGYRRWAMQAPSCGGYVGCGPSYLERWWMKQSIVRLGDILNQSRGIFSTGGFTDIGISGFNLAYLLRDNALQDGDIVQVTISQFGRTIYQGRISLTNAGDRFNLLLRPGVASLVIFAENEGTASPNTAQITLDNVVRGNAVQNYSLRTGQTATLRIEANARGN